jgi:5-(carboxyamino)imidazole ribonucleotide mutase
MAASKTILPVVGVPVEATPLKGFDALLSIMQMPAEVGVATVSVGAKGAKNAALFAAAALASKDRGLRTRLRSHRGTLPSGVAKTGSSAGRESKVVILAESDTDFQVLRHAEDYLAKLSVPYEKVVVHRSRGRNWLTQRVADLEASGADAIIAGSSRGISFACEVGKTTVAPVLGVPIVVGQVGCVDDFLKPFLDMPPGVATFAIGRPGAINAALFAATIITERNSGVWKGLKRMRSQQVRRVRAMKI